MAEPRVAILLLNWNGWRDTIECLDSIYRLEYSNFVVVLCDNASTDESVAHIERWAAGLAPSPEPAGPRLGQPAAARNTAPISVIELTRAEAENASRPLPPEGLVIVANGTNLGFAGGNNVGLRYLIAQSDVDYVWILNNDVVVDRNSLAELVNCARSSPNVGGVGATIFEYADPEVVQAAGGGVFSPRNFSPRLITTPRAERGRPSDEPPSLDFVSGACMLVRVGELRSAGLIDESFFIYCEDVDLGVRIRARGSRLVHARAARIWHKGGRTVGHRTPRHDYYTVRNTLALVRKHYPMMTPFIMAYFVFLVGAPKLVRGQWARLGAAWRGYHDFRKRISGAVPI